MKKQIIFAAVMMFGFAVSLSAQTAAGQFAAGKTTVFVSDFSADAVDSAPSQWTIAEGGRCVVTEVGDQKVLKIEGERTHIYPAGIGVLPDAFTVEYEIWSDREIPDVAFHNFNVEFTDDNDSRIIMLVALNPGVGADHSELNYEYVKPTGEQGAGAVGGSKVNALLKPFTWTKVQVAYRDGAFTAYINGKQVIKSTPTSKPRILRFCGIDREDVPFFVRGFRLAK